MELELPQAPSDVLKATLTHSGPGLVLTLVGAADLRVESYFESLLLALNDRSKNAGVENVTIDLRELTFINSACLKSFVVLISEVRQLGDKAYTITLWQNPAVSWQQRSIKALKAFGEELVIVK